MLFLSRLQTTTYGLVARLSLREVCWQITVPGTNFFHLANEAVREQMDGSNDAILTGRDQDIVGGRNHGVYGIRMAGVLIAKNPATY